MKKTKKFEDGGPTGGRYVDMGDSQVFVPDAPAVVADRPDVVARPMGAGIGPVLSDTAGGFQDNMDRPDVVARPMGLMMPPPNRRMGVRGAVPGTYASGMGGMKKGGTVKKMAKGGSVSSASKRADGCAIKGKTKGRFV